MKQWSVRKPCSSDHCTLLSKPVNSVFSSLLCYYLFLCYSLVSVIIIVVSIKNWNSLVLKVTLYKYILHVQSVHAIIIILQKNWENIYRQKNWIILEMFSLGYNLTYFVQHIFLSQRPLCCVQLYLCCCLCCIVFYHKYTVFASKKIAFCLIHCYHFEKW